MKLISATFEMQAEITARSLWIKTVFNAELQPLSIKEVSVSGTAPEARIYMETLLPAEFLDVYQQCIKTFRLDKFAAANVYR